MTNPGFNRLRPPSVVPTGAISPSAAPPPAAVEPEEDSELVSVPAEAVEQFAEDDLEEDDEPDTGSRTVLNAPAAPSNPPSKPALSSDTSPNQPHVSASSPPKPRPSLRAPMPPRRVSSDANAPVGNGPADEPSGSEG